MEPIDLSHVRIVDNHCHGLFRRQTFADLPAWRRAFTESTGPRTQAEHVAHTLFYRRLLREAATVLGCEPTESSVLAARNGLDAAELTARWFRGAGIAALVVDEGFPEPDAVVSRPELASLTGARVAPVLRLEVRLQELLPGTRTPAELADAIRSEVATARAQGYVALKSIAAYRTGLALETWSEDEVVAAWRVARLEWQATGRVRLAHKPLNDTLLWAAFAEAARMELPVQFHTGYGDTDTDLRLGNPLHLRSLLERPELQSMPVVLLHEAYPYTREGAYLAAVYDQVYLDLSYGIPFLGRDELGRFTEGALAVAPLTKLLYSSDAVGLPELFALSARDGRQAVGQALAAAVGAGELDRAEAVRYGEAILAGNARRLYGLDDPS